MDAALAACSYNCRRGAVIAIVANLDKYVDDTLAKAWNALSFANDYTDGGMFKLRQVHDTDKWKKASHYKIVNGQKVEAGFQSQIRGTVADKPNKIRGDRTDILLYEELGSWPNSTKAFIQGDALVGIQGARFGIKVGGGTGGDTGLALEGLRKMYYDPKAYDILPYRHHFTEDGATVYTGFFIPAHIIVKNNEYGKFMDKRGYTNPDKGKKYWDMRRQTYADKPQDLITFSAEYCFTAEEAFSLEGDNKFNKVIISEQLASIRLHKNAPVVETGRISYTYKNNDHKRENINGYMWTPDKAGSVHILEHPVWTSLYKEQHEGEEVYDYSEMNNLYVAGVDGIDIGKEDTSENTDNPSKFCIVIKKRAFGTQEPQYVAYYKDRPNDVREAYKIAMCLAMYYKAPINIEATKIGMTQWAKAKGFFNWFMSRPDATYPAGTQVKRKTIGTPATPAIIDHQTDLIAQYIEDSGHMIWFEEMLDELMKYSDENKTKYDIVASLGMVELADEQMGSVIPTKIKKAADVWEDVGYYIDEKGYKRWGIIPRQQPSNIVINDEPIDHGKRTSDPRSWGIG